MAWKEFEYSCWPLKDDFNYRPYIEVEVFSNGEKVRLLAIIDSGCVTTMIHEDIAKLLRIDLQICPKVRTGGIGGEGGTGYRSEVNIKFKDFPKVNLRSPVTFSKIPVDMLLGHETFFQNFKVLFEANERKFSLNPITRLK